MALKQEEFLGFNFDNYYRNAALEKRGLAIPKAKKTGTTIVGLKYRDGVILAADTRATAGSIIADKNCVKIHYIAKNIYCCGAGTAADADKLTNTMSSKVELHRLYTGRETPVSCAANMCKQMLFKYQGNLQVALIMGGVDRFGSHIYTLYAHGSLTSLPFTAMGSGSLAAMSVLESRWQPNLSEEDAKKIARDAIAAGIFNDLGSGSNVDLCIIKRDAPVQYLRKYDEANKKGVRQNVYKFEKGATVVLNTKCYQLDNDQPVAPLSDTSMDLS